MKKTIQKIETVLNWYKAKPKDFAGIDELIKARKSLSILSFDLAKIVGDFKDGYDRFYFLRQVEEAKFCSREGDSISQLKATAKNNATIREYYKAEKDNESGYARSKILLNQVNEVLSTMNQHIAYLKEEKKRINNAQPT